MKTIIRDSKSLVKTLKSENYDTIIFFSRETEKQEILTWASVDSGYAGEQDGDQPVMSIESSYYYDLTRKEINVLLQNVRNRHQSIDLIF